MMNMYYHFDMPQVSASSFRSQLFHFMISDKLTTTKTGLQDEDFEVTKKLRRIKLRYDHLYQIVHDLSQSYGHYMYSYRPALIRYIKLKAMISECLQRYAEKIETIYDTLEKNTGGRGLLEKNAEINTIKSDYGPLHKAELKSDIVKKNQEIDRLLSQTERLQAAIESLQRKYNISRNYGIVERYRLMKEMVLKTLREMRQCHNPEYELQWVEKDRSRGATCEQTFFYVRSASF